MKASRWICPSIVIVCSLAIVQIAISMPSDEVVGRKSSRETVRPDDSLPRFVIAPGPPGTMRAAGEEVCNVVDGLFEGPFNVFRECVFGNVVFDPYPLQSQYLDFVDGVLDVACNGSSITTRDTAIGRRLVQSPEADGTIYYSFEYANLPLPDMTPYVPAGYGYNFRFFPIAIEDLDGDGLDDVVVGVTGTLTVPDEWVGCIGAGFLSGAFWYRNVGFDFGLPSGEEPRLPADIDGDCEVGGSDLGILLSQYGSECD